ncbi:hypothetical protein LOB51_08205 [Lactobacillus delbrueckii subsp. bulgaricus]|uniref:hypothetical protein n=1 Tax=Lactobacillus delbrueckii TaxID=1584 RepID=UPI0012BAD681|nr:hypothetical protein [Lactobacillus delbrueckii]MCD5459149.1 hypothetical protein [Lactobacillus delbrueckii subsp. bulgaricus]MCD9226990.1 hypothetical protein [Lactobacillus delbrueckii subsp. bulgaricus]
MLSSYLSSLWIILLLVVILTGLLSCRLWIYCGLIWLRILTGLRIRISEDGGRVPEAES